MGRVGKLPLACVLALAGCGSDAKLDRNGDPLPPHAVMRLGSVRFLTTSNQTDRLEYSPDGKYLATAGFPKYGAYPSGIQIWERATGKDVTPARLQGVEITGVSWAPAGNQFATSHESTGPGTLCVWKVGADEPTRLVAENTLEGPSYSGVVWAREGDSIAALSSKDEIVVFSPRGAIKARWRYTGSDKALRETHTIGFTPDGRKLVCPTAKGLALHDAATGTIEQELEISADKIHDLQVLTNRGDIAVATSNAVEVLQFGAPRESARRFSEEAAFSVAVTSDGRHVAASGYGPFAVWDFASGKRVDQVQLPPRGGVAFSPDGSELALSTRRISFLKAGQWKPQNEEPALGLAEASISAERLWIAEFGPAVYEWNLATGNLDHVVQRPVGRANPFARIDDGRFALVHEAAIEVIDWPAGVLKAALSSDLGPVRSIVAVPSRERLMTVSNSGVTCWDLNTRKPVYDIPLDLGDFQSTQVRGAVSPDAGLFVVSAFRIETQKGSLRAYHVADGSPAWSCEPAGNFLSLCGAWTPDSKRFAFPIARPDDRLEKWVADLQFLDGGTGMDLERFDCGLRVIGAIAFSANGRLAALSAWTMESEEQLELWSMTDRSRLAVLKGHLDGALWLSFTPDSRRLVSVCQDSTALVWDVDEAIQSQAGKNR